MKANISRGGGFRGLLDYVFGPGENNKPDRAELIGGNMSGADPRGLAKEFGISRSLRSAAKRPCWHSSLSLSPGETLSTERWNQITGDYLKEMAINDNHQYCVVRHDDTDHDHVHIIVSRVGLDAKMWGGANDVKKAIKATQALEKKHGLVLTPGFSQSAAVKKLSRNEIEMAIRTGKEPPKQRLQKIINTAKKGNPTASQFVEALAFAGVSAKANVASTGRMSGFSFSIDGISFKASQLGKKYSWTNLKNEVEYVKDRDSATLRQLNSSVADTYGDEATERELTELASPDNGAISEPGIDRGGAAAHHQRGGESSDLKPRRENRSDQQVRESSISSSTENGNSSESGTKKHKEFGQNNRQTGRGSRQNKSKTNIQSDHNNEHVDSVVGRWSVLSGVGDMTMAKFANKQQIQECKTADPRTIFEHHGYEVKRDGNRHLSIQKSGDEYYRSTLKNNSWVHCDHAGNGIGDNISLIRHFEPEKSFPDAVFAFHGMSHSPGIKKSKKVENKRPFVPTSSGSAIDQGRAYLRERGISHETIEQAEQAGFLKHAMDGVFFLGKDPAGEVHAVTKRAVDTDEKRDFAHSDKAYPAILPGSDHVHIVEGGLDALAVHELARKNEEEPPTVIVSGGSNTKSCFETGHVKELLQQSSELTMHYENEKNGVIQEKTDNAHDAQVEHIQSLMPTPKLIHKRKPAKKEYKDLADENKNTESLAQRREVEQQKAFDDFCNRKTKDIAYQADSPEESRNKINQHLVDHGWHKRTAAAFAVLTTAEVEFKIDPKETYSLAKEILFAEQHLRQVDQVEHDADYAEMPDIDPAKNGPKMQPPGPAQAQQKAIPSGIPDGYTGKTSGQAHIEHIEAQTNLLVAQHKENEQYNHFDHGHGPHPGMK